MKKSNPRSLRVYAPSRLHLGLMSFGNPDCRHMYGGLGVMVRSPGLHVGISAAPDFRVEGKYAHRVQEFASRLSQHQGWGCLPDCELRVLSAPREHVGLGTGTQLGMAVAAALMHWVGRLDETSHQVATAVGRGKRSGIGVHGFSRGGLILDAGSGPDSPPDRVEQWRAVPSDWRFVLVVDESTEGLAREAEQSAFATVPAVPGATTARLRHLAVEEILPAVEAADYSRFGRSVTEYGEVAGSCFAKVQGGPYASGAVADRIACLRRAGCEGVGQSSWGPTVFAVTPNQESAETLVRGLICEESMRNCQLIISEPANDGAMISRLDPKACLV